MIVLNKKIISIRTIVVGTIWGVVFIGLVPLLTYLMLPPKLSNKNDVYYVPSGALFRELRIGNAYCAKLEMLSSARPVTRAAIARSKGVREDTGWNIGLFDENSNTYS